MAGRCARGPICLCRVGLRSLFLTVCLGLAGCGGRYSPPVQPDVQGRLSKLFNLYRVYIEKNRKGPPSEEALREFGQKLSAEERESRLIGSDIENLFTSPRDNKKFVVRYNFNLDAGGPKAVAWEAEGKGGRRFVALTRGNVEEYDEESFKEYTK